MRIPSIVATHLRGIDVSHYQSNIDWARVYREAGPGTKDNLVSVAVKCQEGESPAPDSHWERNWKGAHDAGFEFVDAYLFHRPSADPLKSADLFSERILKAGGMRTGNSLSFDFECADTPHTSIVANALSCLWQIEKNLGYTMFRYSAAWFMDSLVPEGSPFCDGPLWVAHYGVEEPKVPKAFGAARERARREEAGGRRQEGGSPGVPPWDWWQYGADGYGAIPGIPVGDHVDHDVFRSGSLEDLRALTRSLRILPVETIPRAGSNVAELTASLLGQTHESE
jgi:GH25 family lysozyme M1 (1,4-beta-N-acetylmuramidase)